MRNMAMPFFPRANTLSLSERTFLADFNIKNKNKFANQQLEAFAVYVLLKMAIGNSSESGFYIKIDDKRLALFASEMLFGIDVNFLKRVLQSCLNNGLFDKELYDKYKVLTSPVIQEEYFFSKTGKERVMSMLPDVKHLIYDFIWEKLKNRGKNEESRPNFEESRPNFGKTKPNKTVNLNIESNTNLQDIQTFKNSLETFKKQFPNNACDGDIPYRSGINFELLAQSVRESPGWLLKLPKTFTWKWLIDHYSDVVSGKYQSLSKTKELSQNRNYTQRTYTDQQLNGLFDDVSKINLEE